MSLKFKLVNCLGLFGILTLCGCGGSVYQRGYFRLVVAEAPAKQLEGLMPTIDRKVIAAIKEIEKDHGFGSGSWGFWGDTVPKYMAYHGKGDATAGRLMITYQPEQRTITVGPWQTESAEVLAIRAAIRKRLYDKLPEVRVDYVTREARD